ncbi:MAG: hypothetical protein SFT94_06845 [Pseudanabaenaceae cyanobacterium bins.68]|nr:hypothetical protein [Pseudanabaenaceae cyanobacterium bins.68]
MNPEFKVMLEQAQDRYLKTEQLAQLETYVGSIPDRVTLYRLLRDRELPILELVAFKLEADLTDAESKQLENSIKYLSLLLRYGAMAMLMQDLSLVKHRLLDWVNQIVTLQDNREIYQQAQTLLEQALTKELSRPQLDLLKPFLPHLS